MRHSLSYDKLVGILRNEDIESLNPKELENILCAEAGISDCKPDPYYRVDPRSGDVILYNAARSRRPHENKVAQGSEPESEDLNAKPSIISQAKTTGVVDVAMLSEGFTFINMNLFPILYPGNDEEPAIQNPESMVLKSSPVQGGHFLQWTSSYQDRDWHNMPVNDCAVVMSRLVKLEETLLKDVKSNTSSQDVRYVSIIKNCGRLVGGSIAHGHQQIAYSTVQPRRSRDLEQFAKEREIPFSMYLKQSTPDGLIVQEYETALLVIPYFMRRPYDMTLIVKNSKKQYLHELNEAEICDISKGWQDGIRGMRAALTGLDRQVAYNITSNTGPGAGIFFDFLPYTQEMGGFEHLGLWVCQGTPEAAAQYLKETLDGIASC